MVIENQLEKSWNIIVNMEKNNIFINNLNYLMDKFSVTSENLCRYLNINLEEYNDILCGGYISMDNEEKISDLFGITTYDLITRDITELTIIDMSKIDTDDYENIAFFNRVLLNYIRMDMIRVKSNNNEY